MKVAGLRSPLSAKERTLDLDFKEVQIFRRSKVRTYKTVKARYKTIKARYKTVKAKYKTIKARNKTVKAHIRQSRPDSGIGVQVKVFKTL